LLLRFLSAFIFLHPCKKAFEVKDKISFNRDEGPTGPRGIKGITVKTKAESF
jgi:hypothetical protein